jgi:hypothetical protein
MGIIIYKTMRYIKLYEGFQSEEEVVEICKKYGIENWSINSEGLVDVYDHVFLANKGLTKLPLKFGTVTGDFHCSYNQLTSLEGSPHTVRYNFMCAQNMLTSLEGSPEKVGGDFYCNNPSLAHDNHNKITSFEGGPKSIGGLFNCYNNPLYNIWNLISPNNKWDNQIIELFNDYDCIRGNDIILDRFNDFLKEIGKDPVESVEVYNNI